MDADTNEPTPDKDSKAESAASSIVPLSPEQILLVIDELHACYDYCAAWKEPPQK